MDLKIDQPTLFRPGMTVELRKAAVVVDAPYHDKPEGEALASQIVGDTGETEEVENPETKEMEVVPIIGESTAFEFKALEAGNYVISAEVSKGHWQHLHCPRS